MSVRSRLYRGLDVARWQIRNPQMLQVRHFLQESQWWSAEEVKAYQEKRLHVLIKHAYEHIPYYRRVMQFRGLRPRDIRGLEDLAKLPVLNKETLRREWKALIADGTDPTAVSVRQTGGTTGEPLKVARDCSNGVYENAAFRRGLALSGHRQGESLVKLFGGTLGLAPIRRLDVLKARLAGEVFLAAFELRRENVHEYLSSIRCSGARFLRGYTSAITLLAKLMKETDERLQLQAIFPTAETLYDHQRDLIKERLGDVFEYYGCGELNSIAFECSAHQGLHISQEHALLEILRDGEAVPEGEMGAVTMTTLQNYTMPLIRYQNSDVAILTSEPCPCGRSLTRIARIMGRMNDLLRTTDGELVSGAFIPHLFRTTTGIEQVQVIQETRERIVVKVVRGPEFAEAEIDGVVKTIRRYLGDVAVDIEYVSSIPTTGAGKLRSVISRVAEQL